MIAYVFFANGFEEVEALTVVDLLRRAEIKVNMVSITKDLNVTGAHNITITTDSLFEENDFAQADILILPGGMPGTTNLLEHKGLKELLIKSNDNKINLAAICAAPSVFGELGILNKKNAIAYPGFEGKLLGANIIDEPIVVDDNIITSKGLGTAIEFSLKIIEILVGYDISKEIEVGIQYKR